MNTQEVFQRYEFPVAGPEHDRIMLCGNPNMNKDMTTCLNEQGRVLTNHREVGNFTLEKAFVLHHE